MSAAENYRDEARRQFDAFLASGDDGSLEAALALAAAAHELDAVVAGALAEIGKQREVGRE